MFGMHIILVPLLLVLVEREGGRDGRKIWEADIVVYIVLGREGSYDFASCEQMTMCSTMKNMYTYKSECLFA